MGKKSSVHANVGPSDEARRLVAGEKETSAHQFARFAETFHGRVIPDALRARGHSVRIYDEMKARGLPVSMYLHQGGHGGNPPADMLNRWFSHYLYGVANGVEKDAPVWIVQDAGAQAPARDAL